MNVLKLLLDPAKLLGFAEDKQYELPDNLFNLLFVLEINLLSILGPHQHGSVAERRVLQP